MQARRAGSSVIHRRMTEPRTGYAPLGDLRLEHAVEMFKLRGGGVTGGLAGMPASQLAVLPGTSHFVPPGSGLVDRTERLLAMIPPFLDP
jgi:hypothetical protein